jgi:hypothetical protein
MRQVPTKHSICDLSAQPGVPHAPYSRVGLRPIFLFVGEGLQPSRLSAQSVG